MMPRAVSEVISTLLMIGLGMAIGVFASWIISSFIASTATTAEFASISFVEVVVSPVDSRVAAVEIALTVSGGVTGVSSVRIWHNDQGPLQVTCLDCSTLVSQGYPSSRVDTLYVTAVVRSQNQFRVGDYLRVEVEYVSGGVTKKTSGVFRVLSTS
ncbi:MAG: hypothetical protein QXS62_06365 [Sulfolobales archaeon]